MADVLVDLLNNYEKVVLLSHVVLSGSAKDDCFSTVLSDGAGGVKLNCYDGFISISSAGAVTYTVASPSGMAKDIADTNNMIAPAWSATATYTKNSIVRDGCKLYISKSDVPTGTATSNTTYWSEYNIAYILKSILANDFSVGAHTITVPIFAMTGFGMRGFIFTTKVITDVSCRAFNGAWVDLEITNLRYNYGMFVCFECALASGFSNNNVYGCEVTFTVI
jgi:hypothetical protein